MSSFAYVSSELGNVKPETRSIAEELYNVAKAAGREIWFMWGIGTSAEHKTGLALDLMVRNEAAGDFVRNYIWANRERLRLRHVIWEQHITSTVVQPGVRRKMADRGDPTDNHYDHNHVWFFRGSYRPPPSPTPKPPISTPKPPVTKPTVKQRTLYWNKTTMLSGNDVLALQKGLRRVFPLYAGRLVLDGKFGRATDKAVREFQRRAGLKVNGRVGPATRAALRRYGVRL
ncbi:peptidoglycan-binding domain-containing protein [Micromonospora sp. IBHARD004]|uniref:peptidoglycan-binding domain-containing protein n=1 Tax=Micromonospora sp. IBHARD004 TaxID=3457764 RepID=UPI0040596AA6